MALRSKSICRQPGCGKLLDVSGYCEPHAKHVRRQSDARRESSSKRGYGRAWQKSRASYLSRHPLCCHCEADGMVVPATEVDHIVAHKGDQALFWDSKNWQPLCKPCHSKKTAREDGGYGREGG